MADIIYKANDFFIEKDYEGVYDFVIENGQFKVVDSFDTALQMVLYCERRADASEVPQPQYRRGWWGNEVLSDIGFEIGSKLWLLYQERLTDAVLSKAITFTKQGCQWLIDDGHLKDVEVRGEFLIRLSQKTGIRLFINFVTFDNKIESRYYDLWQNTGNRTVIPSTIEIGYLLTEAYQISAGDDEQEEGEETITVEPVRILLDGFDEQGGGALLLNLPKK